MRRFFSKSFELLTARYRKTLSDAMEFFDAFDSFREILSSFFTCSTISCNGLDLVVSGALGAA